MPHTLAELRSGAISEWRATLLVRETAGLTREDRSSRAARDRHVSLRPAPDCMARISALVPVAQVVATYAPRSRPRPTRPAPSATRAAADR